jgi:hypothetical protein
MPSPCMYVNTSAMLRLLILARKKPARSDILVVSPLCEEALNAPQKDSLALPYRSSSITTIEAQSKSTSLFKEILMLSPKKTP